MALMMEVDDMPDVIEMQTANVPAAQLDALRNFATGLAPSHLSDLLLGLADVVAEGNDITVFGSDAELTPNQVALRLKMSRTHLYKLLDNGHIPSHRVGRDRRVRVSDLVSFEADRQRERRELAERFAQFDATRAAAIDELLE